MSDTHTREADYLTTESITGDRVRNRPSIGQQKSLSREKERLCVLGAIT